MSRPRLRKPSQSWPVQLLFGLCEFSASLKLAVVLIFTLAGVLAYATFVESVYGTESGAVRFMVYGTWWFALLNALLALNIFSAAAIRWPWKRHQTGFVVTHIGLLVLLLGCLISWDSAIDAQMPIIEGGRNNKAYEDQLTFQVEVTDREGGERSTEVITVPFHHGPFNWKDYDYTFGPFQDEWETMPVGRREFVRWTRPLMYLPYRDQGLISDSRLAEQGIEVRVKDFYANSSTINVPKLTLQMSSPVYVGEGDPPPQFAQIFNNVEWNAVELTVPQSAKETFAEEQAVGPMQRNRPQPWLSRQGGGLMIFWMLNSQEELKAFLAKPDVSDLGLGPDGQVVLRAGGKTHRFRVDQKLGQGRFSLEGTNLEAELVYHYKNALMHQASTAENPLAKSAPVDERGDNQPAVQVTVYGDNGRSQSLLLWGNRPERPAGKPSLGVYGTYWPNQAGAGSEQLLRGSGGSRVDLVQGPDEMLYQRRWNRQEVVAAGPVDLDGDPLVAFEMPGLKAVSRFYVPGPESFQTADKPGPRIIPQKFERKQPPAALRRAALVELTVDGQSEEFWIIAHGLLEDQIAQVNRASNPELSMQDESFVALDSDQRYRISVGDKSVKLTMPARQIPLNFNVHLDEFERRLDPGSSRARHYGSELRLKTLEDQPMGPDDGKVEIAMNAPVDVQDPVNKRTLRVFQESFNELGRVADDEQSFISVLTINYDPGRGIKYLGCALTVFGIMIMFYMKAYFFKRAAAGAKQA